jgi:hypothetical protein
MLPPSVLTTSGCCVGATSAADSSPRTHAGTRTGSRCTRFAPTWRRAASAQAVARVAASEPESRAPTPSASARVSS